MWYLTHSKHLINLSQQKQNLKVSIRNAKIRTRFKNIAVCRDQLHIAKAAIEINSL